MKDSKYLLLCCNILAFSIQIRALPNANPPPKNGLRDATQWEELKKTDSETVNVTSEKCEQILTATRRQYMTVVERLQHMAPQITTTSTLKSHVEDVINEINQAMRTCSRQIDEQLEGLGEEFLRRLQKVVSTAQSVNRDVAKDLEQIARSEIEETDKLAISIRLFVTDDYNPLNKILPAMHKSLNYSSNYLEEYRKIVRNDVELLLKRMDQEFDQIEKIVIDVLNRISKGMTVMKAVYASLRKTEKLPSEWDRTYIMNILHLGTLMSKTANVDDDDFRVSPQAELRSENEPALDMQTPTFKTDIEHSSEQDDDEEKEEDDLGCVLIFSRAKRKMLRELILTITGIKSLQSIKEIDIQFMKILQHYGLVFHDLHFQLVSKIIDYSDGFVKLYKMTMDIMDMINPGMKFKMETIYEDTTVDQKNPLYAELRRFFTANYLTPEKIHELRQQIEASIRGARTLKEIQKKVSKELVAITTTLGKDLEDIKMVVIYTLEEMREGVLALKHISENANIKGYNFYINFYDGKTDLKQLRKLMMILNMLDINRMFDRELVEIVSGDQVIVSRNLTNILLDEIKNDSTQFEKEVDRSKDIKGVQRTVMKCTSDFNKMILNYTYKVRKFLKRKVTTFVTAYKEFMILLNRRRIQNAEELEQIPESADLDMEIGLIRTYLADNTQINVEELYGASFSFNSPNIDQSRGIVKKQMHALIEVMSSELTQLDLQIENIVDKVIQEAQNINIIKQQLAANKVFTIESEQFPNLGLILYLSDFLQVLSAQNNVKKSHSQEVYKTFNNAREQIESTKGNAEQPIRESTEFGQLKVQIAEITTEVRSVLLDVGSDIKENLTEISSNFMNMFETFTNGDEQLKEQIANGNVQNEPISDQLKDYLTNRYANHILHSFSTILSHSPHDINIADAKDLVLGCLDETIEKIEQDMDAVKTETVVNVVGRLSQGIELMDHLQNKGKLVISEEENNLLATCENIIGTLQNFFSTDSTYDTNEMQNDVNSARKTITREYSRAMTNIQSASNEADIQTELSHSEQLIADTYTSLSSNIRGSLQSFASTFIESYEFAMSNVLGKNDKLEFTMQDIMNNQGAPMQHVQLENTIAFIQSEPFVAASEWVNSLWQSIMQDDISSTSLNEAAAHQLGTLHGYIDNAIGNIHETVITLVQNFKQSSTIIQSIKDDYKQELNDDQINNLRTSFQLINLLTQESAVSANDNSDFDKAAKLIADEFQNTVKAIESSKDDTVAHDLTVKAVENCATIYENLRSTTAELFTRKISEFTASYSSVKEMAEYTGNVELQNMLTEIINTRETLQPSPQLIEVEAFVTSEKFTSSTLATQQLENMPQVTNVEKLSNLTTMLEANIGEMEQVGIYIQSKVETAIDFLTSIENSGIIQWSQEQITVIAETISITDALNNEETSSASNSNSSESNSAAEAESNSAAEADDAETVNSGIRSLGQTTPAITAITSDVFSETRSKILLEFDAAKKLIEEATNEISIQQTIDVTIERFDTIFNDLQNKFKDNINHSLEGYENLYLDAQNIENIQLQSTLQEISQNEYSATPSDADFSKIVATISGAAYQSPNLGEMMYEQIHSKPNNQSNINEQGLEELKATASGISQTIREMEYAEKIIQQNFQQGSDILGDIKSGLIEQLSEEQINILAINAHISQLIQLTPGSPAEIPSAPATDLEYISETRNTINNELQATINTIQSITDEEGIAEATTDVIQKTETIFNDLKKDFEIQVTEKLVEFKERYESALEMSQTQGNVQLVEVLENTSNNKENTDLSTTWSTFSSFVESNTYTSATAIADMFQAIPTENNPTDSTKDWNISALQTISSTINEQINNMEDIATQVGGTLQQGIGILEEIKNGQIVELTEVQLSIISSSCQIEQVLSLNKPLDDHVTEEEIAVDHVTEEEITETEVAIKKEFEQTVAALELLSDEGEIQETVGAVIENTDSIFSALKDKVQVEFTFTATTFEQIVTTFETTSNSPDNTVIEQINQIFHGETVVETNAILAQIENYIQSEVYKSQSPVQILYNDIQPNEELNFVEQSIQSIKTLDIQVTENIETMSVVRQNILQNFEQGTEIMEAIRNNNAEFTDQQAQVLSVCRELTKIISPNSETLPLENVSIDITTEECDKAKLQINEVYENTKKQIESLVDVEAIEKVALESVQDSENIYNNLKMEAQTPMTENSIKFQQTLEATLTIVQANNNEETANILKSLPDSEPNTDEAFNKFETYRHSDSYNSETYVERMYQDMQNDTTQSFNSPQEKRVEQLKLVNTALTNDIDNLQEMCSYTAQNINTSLEILERIRNDSSIVISEEEKQILVLSNAMITTPTVPAATHEENSNWSLFSLWQSDQEKINLTETKDTLNEEYSKTIELLQTLDTAEEIQPVVDKFVENSNALYNGARESIQTKIIENSESLLQHYDSTMKDENLQETMANLNTEAYTFEPTAEYTEFKVLVTSSFFTSVEAIKETFSAIQEGTPIENDSLAQRSVQELEELNGKTEDYIDKIGRIDTFVTDNFTKASEILNKVENNDITSLTNEQVQTLALSQEIIHNLISSDKLDKPTVPEDTQLEGSIQTIADIDITSTMETLTEELNTPAQAIELAPDENTVPEDKQLEGSIQTIADTDITSTIETLTEELNTPVQAIELAPDKNTVPEDKQLEGSIQTIADIDNTSTIETLTEELNTPVQAIELAPDENTVPEDIQLEGSIQTIADIDITSTIETLTEELNTSVQAIELAPDKNKVQQIVTDTVQKYEEVFGTVRTEMQTKMVENVSSFENCYTQTADAVSEGGNSNTSDILQNIGTIQIEENQTFMEFVSFVSSDTYNLPNPIEALYNTVKQDDASTTTNFHEKGAQELQFLNDQVVDNISTMQKTTSYGEQILRSGLDVLQLIQTEATVDLTDSQIQELALSYTAAQTIEKHTTELSIPANTVEFVTTDTQLTSIDTTTAKATIQEDYEIAMQAIRSATDEESIQAAIEDSIQNFDSVYTVVKETVKSEIDVSITQFTQVRNSLATENEGEIDNEVRNILQNNEANIETDENFIKFEEFIGSDKFKSSSLAADMYMQMMGNENLATINANQKAEEELTLLSTQINESITGLEETKQYITQQLADGARVLESVRRDPSYQPAEQEIVQISLSQTIISTFLCLTAVETEIQTDFTQDTEANADNSTGGTEIPTVAPDIIDTIQSQKEEAANRIAQMNDEESIKQVVIDVVNTYDTALTQVKDKVDQKITESTRAYEENYQTAIQLIRESDEQYKKFLQSKESFVPDERYENFEKYVKNGGFQVLPTAESILDEVENGELFTRDINEKCTVELDIISSQIAENVMEFEENASYVTTNLENGSVVLELIATDQNAELTEQQIETVTLSHYIMQVLSSVTPAEELQVQTTQAIPEVDFARVETTMDKKVDESIRRINALTDEGMIEHVVAENVQESGVVYASLQQDVLQKINRSSSSFVDTFQTTASHLPEESPLKEIFEQIVNTPLSLDLNAEYQQVRAELNDENVMSSSAVDNIYNAIKESDTLPEDVKERAIYEVKDLNEKVKENMVTMKHIDEFVSTNLQEGLTILQDIEGAPQVQELTEQQIQRLSLGTAISETLTTQTPTESSTWNAFLSYATDVISNAGEEEQLADRNTSTSTTEVEDLSTMLEIGENIIEATRSVTTTTEITESIVTVVQTRNEDASRCVISSNVTSVKSRIQNSCPISVKNFLVAVDTNSLTTCQHLTWNTDKFSPDDKKTIEEIREYLLAARNIIAASLPYQQSRINFYQNTNDVLVVFVNTVELIDEVLQQLSFVMLQKTIPLMAPIIQQIQNSNVKRELENTASSLDAEFVDVFEIFASLMLYEGTDLLNMVDEQFAEAQCPSLEVSREIITKKFSTLTEIIDKIFGCIVCIVLTIINLVVNSKIQQNAESLQTMKNIQILYEIISQING